MATQLADISGLSVANRGAAAEALEKAEAAFRMGDVDKARRLALKSQKLFPNAEAKNLLLQVGDDASVGSEPSSGMPPPRAGLMYKEGHVARTWKKRYFALEKGSLRYFRDAGRAKLMGEFDLRGAQQTECDLGESRRELRGKATWVVRTSDVGRLELAVRGGGGKPMHERYLLAVETAEESSVWRRAIAAHILFASASRLSIMRPTISQPSRIQSTSFATSTSSVSARVYFIPLRATF